MQGFIKTTAGLRPVLLDGIEEVTYTTNAGGLYHTGSLGIKYIPNSGTGTGNIFLLMITYNILLKNFGNGLIQLAQGKIKLIINF